MRTSHLLLTLIIMSTFGCSSPKSDGTGEASEQETTETEEVVVEPVKVPDPAVAELKSAIKANDLQKVKNLINQGGIDLDYKFHYDDPTPLLVACEMGNLAIAKLLVEAGADVNLTIGEFVDYASPSTKVIESGNVELLTYLGSNGANIINQASWFVDHNDNAMFGFLIDQGMDLDQKIAVDVEEEYTRLAYALSNADFETALFFYENGATVPNDIVWNISSQDAFTFLNELGFDYPNAVQVKQAIGDASIYSIFDTTPEKINLILSHGLNPDHNSLMVIGSDEALKTIFDQSAYKHLDFAKSYTYHEFVGVYSGFAKYIPELNAPLLTMASITGNPTLVKLLLENGADPNQKDLVGRVPIFYTLVNDNNGAADILEEKGAQSRQLTQSLIELPEWFKAEKPSIDQIKSKFSFCEFLPHTNSSEYGLDGDGPGLLATFNGDSIFYVNEGTSNQITVFSPHCIIRDPHLSVGMTARALFDRVNDAEIRIEEISGHEGFYNRENG